MEKFIDDAFAFFKPFVGSKEAGIIEIVVGLIIVISCAIYFNKKKK